jgi:hypothetical protein
VIREDPKKKRRPARGRQKKDPSPRVETASPPRRALANPDASALEVTAPFGVLICGALAPNGLSAPPTAFRVSPSTLGVFATPPSPYTLAYGSSSLGLRPPPASCGASPPPGPKAGQLPPRGFLPLRAFSTAGRPLRRMPHRRRLFRPQVFSTSRRLAPGDALRAYFIPLARPGLPLQGLSLPRSRIASRRPLPSCRYHRSPSALADGERTLARLQGLAPLESPLLDRLAVKLAGDPMPSWGSPSPGSSLPRPWATLPQPSPRELRWRSYGTLSSLLPRVFPNRGLGLSLARLPTLLRFPTSSDRSPARVLDRTGLIVSPRARRRVAAAPLALFGPCRLPTPFGAE